MSLAIKFLAGFVLLLLAIVIASHLLAKGLIHIEPPLPESTEKARFLRTLTCAYAMCARERCDSSIIDVGFLDKEKKISCYRICKEWEDKGHTGHKCGPEYNLTFVFDDTVTYKADYHKRVLSPIRFWITWRRLDTDVTRENWEERILGHDERCFNEKNEKVTLGGYEYDRGCTRDIDPPDNVGLCEGVLQRMSGDECVPGDKSGNWIPADRFKEDCGLNTGHIWVDSKINCGPFESGNYLMNCTFEEGQTIYIWAEIDLPLERPLLPPEYCFCPELVICSSPTT
jgi:hypothetical protein